MIEECLACFNSSEGYCSWHIPESKKPISWEMALALACEQMVQDGLAERFDEGTISIKIRNEKAN